MQSGVLNEAGPIPGYHPQLSASSGREALPMAPLAGMATEHASVTEAVTTIGSTVLNENLDNNGPSRTMQRSASETTDQRKMRNRAA